MEGLGDTVMDWIILFVGMPCSPRVPAYFTGRKRASSFILL